MAAGDLTTLGSLRAYPEIPSDADSGFLQTLIAAVSDTLQREIGRTIVQTEYLAERHDHNGMGDLVQLDQWPLISVEALTLSSTATAATEYELLKPEGQLSYTPGGELGDWPAGRRHIVVDYTAGYAVIPPALEHAACTQIQNEYRRAKTPGMRSTVIGEGATATWLVDALLPQVLHIASTFRRRLAA